MRKHWKQIVLLLLLYSPIPLVLALYGCDHDSGTQPAQNLPLQGDHDKDKDDKPKHLDQNKWSKD